MSEGAFRRLDVDQYDEDRVLPAQLYTPDPRGPTQVLEVTRRKTSECRALLQRCVLRLGLGAWLMRQGEARG